MDSKVVILGATELIALVIELAFFVFIGVAHLCESEPSPQEDYAQ